MVIVSSLAAAEATIHRLHEMESFGDDTASRGVISCPDDLLDRIIRHRSLTLETTYCCTTSNISTKSTYCRTTATFTATNRRPSSRIQRPAESIFKHFDAQS